MTRPRKYSSKAKHRAAVSVSQLEMLQQGVKATGNLLVPLRPIVDSRACVEFKSEFAFLKPLCKASVRLKERFLLSDREVDVWSPIGAR